MLKNTWNQKCSYFLFQFPSKTGVKRIIYPNYKLCDEEMATTSSKLLQQLIHFLVKNLHVTLEPKGPAIESCLYQNEGTLHGFL